ncbi:hypothetical protein KUTeg_016254 [Tegillarca granosa]|uniref:Uncharacterized protein n=1 Tax=Tegillarca granosa TaxID=220873 RepID=A0ABQ9EKB0_TEGGR|nr:hypothetical protein KUTeg_016254 [Tegillarca granosa]
MTWSIVGSEKTRNVPEKEKSFKRLCVRFAEKTSMTGVPYINSARLTVSKITWTILLIGAIGAMIFHLYYLCNQFFSWPKITKLTLQFSNLQLPEVTICNNNIIKKSQLHLASKQLQNYVRDLNPQKLGIKGRKRRFIPKLMDFNFSAYTGYGGDMFKTLNDEDDDADLGPDNEIVQIDILNYSLLLSTCDIVKLIINELTDDERFTVRPNGRPNRPNGRPNRPNGRPNRPNGRPNRPNGRPNRPNGRPNRRNGRPNRPNGRPNRPNGRPNRPNGRPNRPNGRPIDLMVVLSVEINRKGYPYECMDE